MIRRRTLLAPLAPAFALAACAAPFPPPPEAVAPDALALLQASASAHGSAALAGMRDLSVSYAGEWRPIVPKLQPDLVDAGHRRTSEERILLRAGVSAAHHTGPAGEKHVVRTPRTVQVWFDGQPSAAPAALAAAALVADNYALFLLGPMRILRLPVAGLTLEAPDRITVDGQPHECDIVRARLAPGLGLSDADQVTLWIDRSQRLMRRLRFSLEGLDSSRGAIAEVDAWGHTPYAGLQIPTRFHERLLRPLPIPVHDWTLTGLDLDRGLTEANLAGPAFSERAATPAARWTAA